MRIIVVNTQAPFVSGGAEEHARRLLEELRARGHQAEAVTIPFNWSSPDAIIDHAVAAANIDVSGFFGESIDLMIGLRFPAYLMRHPNKAVWLIHQYREAYDLWDAGRSGLRNDPKGNLVRQIITDMDTRALSQTIRLYANSRNVASRLRKYNGLEASPLYHPPPLAAMLRPGDVGDYLYFPSRISSLKRQSLVLEALACTRSQVRVVFSGNPDSARDAEMLHGRIAELGLEGRALWRGHVPVEEMVDLYANALGVVFPPFDEDLGYVTQEAMLAEKPVVTTTDSGGPLEFIVDEKHGLIVKPEPRALAEAFDRLFLDRDLARNLGRMARKRYDELSISWDSVVAKLTGTE